MVHAKGLEPGVGDDPSLCAHRDDGGEHRQCLGEGQVEGVVVGVEQRVGAGLNFGAGRVDVEGAGTSARHDVATHLVGRVGEQCHRLSGSLCPLGAIRHHHQVALVPHHPSHLEPGRPGQFGEGRGLGRFAAAAG